MRGSPEMHAGLCTAMRRIRSGANLSEIADDVGVCTKTIYNWAKRFGGIRRVRAGSFDRLCSTVLHRYERRGQVLDQISIKTKRPAWLIRAIICDRLGEYRQAGAFEAMIDREVAA